MVTCSNGLYSNNLSFVGAHKLAGCKAVLAKLPANLLDDVHKLWAKAVKTKSFVLNKVIAISFLVLHAAVILAINMQYE